MTDFTHVRHLFKKEAVDANDAKLLAKIRGKAVSNFVDSISELKREIENLEKAKTELLGMSNEDFAAKVNLDKDVLAVKRFEFTNFDHGVLVIFDHDTNTTRRKIGLDNSGKLKIGGI